MATKIIQNDDKRSQTEKLSALIAQVQDEGRQQRGTGTFHIRNEEVADHLIASGVVVPPPVKIGDTLFYVMEDGTIYSGQVYSLRWEFHKDYGIRSEICARSGAYFIISASFDDFGKTVFFTKEEAEQSLKEDLV